MLTRAKRKQYQYHASEDYVEIRESMYHDQEVGSASYILNINRCTECAQSIKSHFCVLYKQKICKIGLKSFRNLILKYVSDAMTLNISKVITIISIIGTSMMLFGKFGGY